MTAGGTLEAPRRATWAMVREAQVAARHPGYSRQALASVPGQRRWRGGEAERGVWAGQFGWYSVVRDQKRLHVSRTGVQLPYLRRRRRLSTAKGNRWGEGSSTMGLRRSRRSRQPGGFTGACRGGVLRRRRVDSAGMVAANRASRRACAKAIRVAGRVPGHIAEPNSTWQCTRFGHTRPALYVRHGSCLRARG